MYVKKIGGWLRFCVDVNRKQKETITDVFPFQKRKVKRVTTTTTQGYPFVPRVARPVSPGQRPKDSRDVGTEVRGVACPLGWVGPGVKPL